MTTTEDFDTAWDKLHEKLGWVLSSLKEDGYSAGKEAFLYEAKVFLDRWDDHSLSAFAKEYMAKLKAVVASVDRRQQIVFLTDLHHVLMERLDCFNAEDDFQLTVKACTGDSAALDRMKWVNGFDLSGSFDAQAEFRRTDAAVSTQEQDYVRVLVRLKSDWPDRFTEAMLQRLARGDSDDLVEWGEDVTGERFDLRKAREAANLVLE